MGHTRSPSLILNAEEPSGWLSKLPSLSKGPVSTAGPFFFSGVHERCCTVVVNLAAVTTANPDAASKQLLMSTIYAVTNCTHFIQCVIEIMLAISSHCI